MKEQIDLEVDMDKPYGIKGLPEQWVQKIHSSKISAKQVKQNPEGMISVISKYESDIFESEMEKKILSTEEFQEMIAEVEFIEENPATFYVFDKELGKGAMCKVFYAFDRH